MHRIKGPVLWLDASRCLREDSSGCAVSSQDLPCILVTNSWLWIAIPLCHSCANYAVCNVQCAFHSYLSPLSELYRTGYEQDVENGNTTRLGDCHGETSLAIHWTHAHKHHYVAHKRHYSNLSRHSSSEPLLLLLLLPLQHTSNSHAVLIIAHVIHY